MFKQAVRLSTVGIEMGVSVIIGITAGTYLDKKFETDSLFFWIGFTLGLGAAIKAVSDSIKTIKKIR
jgi:F0F1-type ATP synthase assembly protein I